MTLREEMLNLLRTDAAFREEVRRQVLTDEVLGLPALVRELAEIQRRTEVQIQRQGEQLQQLTAQVQRQGEQLQQLTAQVQRQGEQFQQLTAQVQRQGEQFQQLTAQVQRQGEQLQQLTAQVQRQGEQLQQLTAQVQRQGEQLQQLTAQVQRQGEQLQQLTAQVQRQGEQLQQLTAQVQRQGEQLQQLTAQVQRQGEQFQSLVLQVQELVSWQRGEAGRRDGERYERSVVRRAAVLFNGGQGGSTDEFVVRQRLTVQLGDLLRQDILPPEVDPFLADLVWWKNGQVAVVEASLKVNGEDIQRAAQRAATLRQSGATALPVVIGEEWATWDARQRAQSAKVEWKVGIDLSEGLVAFRRLPATSDETRQA